MATITVNRDGSERPGGFIAHKGRPFLHIVKVEFRPNLSRSAAPRQESR